MKKMILMIDILHGIISLFLVCIVNSKMYQFFPLQKNKLQNLESVNKIQVQRSKSLMKFPMRPISEQS